MLWYRSNIIDFLLQLFQLNNLAQFLLLLINWVLFNVLGAYWFIHHGVIAGKSVVKFGVSKAVLQKVNLGLSLSFSVLDVIVIILTRKGFFIGNIWQIFEYLLILSVNFQTFLKLFAISAHFQLLPMFVGPKIIRLDL